jgi:hypothetical protein
LSEITEESDWRNALFPGDFPIGGYFELELPLDRFICYPNAIKYQSARAAFAALLKFCSPTRVWLPAYICNSMIAPIIEAKIEYNFYHLDIELKIAETVPLKKGELLLYVNYFGLCGRYVQQLLELFPRDQLVLDFSQAFFEAPPEVLATIYSPRKFFGLPDGGLLVSSCQITPPEAEDHNSLSRFNHLLMRIAEGPEAGYIDFQQAEFSLHDCTPMQMSKLTQKILNSINFDSVKKKRIENFDYLHKKLGKRNSAKLCLDKPSIGPLCYPFISSNPNIRRKLINSRVFIPTYWPEALERVDMRWASFMIEKCLPLPVDQRYCPDMLEKIVSIIESKA